MMGSRFSATVGLLALFSATAGTVPALATGSTTVADPALERRLDHTLIFTARSGDTLAGLARWIYGHSTWWARIRAADPALQNAGPDQVLPQGSRLFLSVPTVAHRYRTHPRDTVPRVILWRYGSLVEWRLEGAEALKPGDTLEFQEGPLWASLRNTRTGRVLAQRGHVPDSDKKVPVPVSVSGPASAAGSEPVPVFRPAPRPTLVPPRPPAPTVSPPAAAIPAPTPAPKPVFFEEARVLSDIAAGEHTPWLWARRHARPFLILGGAALLILLTSLGGLTVRGLRRAPSQG